MFINPNKIFTKMLYSALRSGFRTGNIGVFSSRMFRRITSNVTAFLFIRWRPNHLIGPAKVIDGDTIIIAGEWVRLHGIDAPEMDQTFQWRGRRLPCGMMASAALEALTAGVTLRCQPVERDRHGRLVAKCFSLNGTDIGRRLVWAGWALAYRRYSTDYVDAESAARDARRGLWKGQFTPPWEWRRSSPPPRLRTEPSGVLRFPQP